MQKTPLSGHRRIRGFSVSRKNNPEGPRTESKNTGVRQDVQCEPRCRPPRICPNSIAQCFPTLNGFFQVRSLSNREDHKENRGRAAKCDVLFGSRESTEKTRPEVP